MMLPYRLGLLLFVLLVRCASAIGHPKARKAWRGRKGWQERLVRAEEQARMRGRKGPWVHVHCASLGEFEQGTPVIREWRRRHPESPMLLTFFSPSGMEGVHAPEVDHVDYLPFDLLPSVRRFSRLLTISDTILIKYEIWPELIRALNAAGTRIHLVAARFDAGRHPLGWTGTFIRRSLGQLHGIQVQDERSAGHVLPYRWPVRVTGDPRVDQVLYTTTATPSERVAERLERITEWKERRKLLLVGSAWPGEWAALRTITEDSTDWVVLWFPHEVHAPYVADWAGHHDADWLSSWQGHTPGPGPWKTFSDIPGNPGMLVEDEIGVLKHAYRLADLAVVGGGWGKGVHNILEPAAFGVPVLCGPNVAGFREVEALSEMGAARVCASPEMLAGQCRDWMRNDDDRHRAGQAAAEWVERRKGTSRRIVDAISSC